MSRSAASAVFAVALVACGHNSSPPIAPAPAPTTAAPASPSAPPAAADPTPPELRLPTFAHPLRNSVELTLDPASDDFTGTITTELEITSATNILWLDASEIAIDRATLALAAGGESLTPRVIATPKDFVGLAFPRELAPGRATLTISYRGKAHPDDGDGIYRVKERDEWYAFTQFENTDARQAFPCFDEPGYKVPWRVTLHTKRPLVALSNMPIESEADEPGGMKVTRFVETPPLPSYLVAFVVGPFDLVAAGKSSAGVPIRVVVPKGRAADADYAVKTTAPILDLLVDYFGTPFPFPKLDLVAVAVFNAGAMENPGLITFRQDGILIPVDQLTRGREYVFAVDVAHEMAHMWFGDLVTMAWWDDVWLNESFASWMETKIVAKWKPDWHVELDTIELKSRVMRQDSLDSARTIRQPIRTDDDIANAFDGITYGKGEVVLDMIEHAIDHAAPPSDGAARPAQVGASGADAFQAGVRAYLAKHARGNGTYDDFVGAMSASTGKDLKPLFDSFVLQSGVPAISFELACGKGAPPKLALAQERYKPIGSKIDPKRLWTVPVCARWGAGAATGVDCTTLATETGELALTAKTCPDWVVTNADGYGYYRSRLRGDLLKRLLVPHKPVTLRDRIGLIGDVNAAVASGHADEGVALALVASLAKEQDRHFVGQSVAIVEGIHEMVPDALQPNYQRFIRKLYGARAHELGWTVKPGDSDDIKDLRRQVVGFVAALGRDPELIAQAKTLAWKWLDDHKAVDASTAGEILETAAMFGDQKLFDRLHADAVKTKDREERERLLGALGAFRDPAIVQQALAITLTDEFELRDSANLLRSPLAEPSTRAVALAFVEAHFDQIADKLPAPYRAMMAFTFVAVCDDAKKPEIESKFGPRIATFIGGPRVMAQAMESLSLCAAQRQAQTPGVVQFLKKQ